MAIIPPFTESGILPPGDYKITFQQLKKSPLVINDIPKLG